MMLRAILEGGGEGTGGSQAAGVRERHWSSWKSAKLYREKRWVFREENEGGWREAADTQQSET